jgi:hypothetical protein
MRVLRRIGFLAVLSTALVLPTSEVGAAPSATCSPRITTLPGLGGGFAEARAVNRHRVIVGTAVLEGVGLQAVWWDRSGQVHRIRTGSGLADSALGVNDSGEIVGIADNVEAGFTRGWHRSRAGTVRMLAVPPGFDSSYAAQINNRGEIAGFLAQIDGLFVPVVWRGTKARPVRLPLAKPYLQGVAFGINNAGVVVGAVATESGEFVPARWVGERPPEVLRVGGAIRPGTGYAVNNKHQVAGSAGSPEQAARWQRDGSGVPLSPLDVGSTGYGINGRGGVAGIAVTVTETRAFVWPGHGTPRILPSLVPGGRTGAYDVDDRGTAIGFADDATGATWAAVWHCALPV